MGVNLVGACLLLIVCTQLVTSNIEFGEVRTIFRLNVSIPSINETIGLITVVQQDTVQPNRFIVGIATALFSVNLLEQDFAPPELMVGDIIEDGYREGDGAESRFHGISSVVQIEQPRGLIIADRWNHCLRLVEPARNVENQTWKTSTYAGACKKQGSFNGAKSHASFSRPTGLLKRDNIIYIADSYNKRIRQLDMDSEEVTTIHQSQKFEMYQLTFGRMKNEFFTTVRHGILQVRNEGERWLAGGESSKRIIAYTQFTNTNFASPSAIVRLSDGLLLATDNGANCLKLIDLERLEVRPIGAGWGTEDGNIQISRFKTPYALTVVDGKILIGEEAQIRLLHFKIKEASGAVPTQNVSQCEDPPIIHNAKHLPLGSYPEGSTVYYKCADSHTGNMITDYLVCTRIESRMVWIGGQINCRLSNTTVGAIALAPVCAAAVIAAGVLAMKLKRNNKMKSKLMLEMLEMNEFITSIQTNREIHTLPPQRPSPSSGNDYYEPIESVLTEPPYYAEIVDNSSANVEATSNITEDFTI